jgi:hypothetical protein
LFLGLPTTPFNTLHMPGNPGLCTEFVSTET